MCPVGRDDVGRAVGPTEAPHAVPADPPRGNPEPRDERTLLRELWQISHFGWIPEAAIRRSLTISAGQEIPAALLAERLQQLLGRRWAEQRHRGRGTSADDREWRLTESGRNAR
jgi:hypothetical protein